MLHIPRDRIPLPDKLIIGYTPRICRVRLVEHLDSKLSVVVVSGSVGGVPVPLEPAEDASPESPVREGDGRAVTSRRVFCWEIKLANSSVDSLKLILHSALPALR